MLGAFFRSWGADSKAATSRSLFLTEVPIAAKRTSTNIISAIANQGKVRFQIYDGRMNAHQLIEFLLASN